MPIIACILLSVLDVVVVVAGSFLEEDGDEWQGSKNGTLNSRHQH